MSKHTPGPWSFYDDSNDGRTNRIEIVAIGKTVARIYHSVPAEDLPNARLIAAAPDLLAALNEFSDYVHAEQCSTDGAVTYSNTQINRLAFLARAAIAKATGGRD